MDYGFGRKRGYDDMSMRGGYGDMRGGNMFGGFNGGGGGGMGMGFGYATARERLRGDTQVS